MCHRYSFGWFTAKKLIVFCVCQMLLIAARSQNPILVECMNINKTYVSTPYLSFNVKYKYSLDSLPTVIMDSSQGVFKMNGYKYWGKIDSVEMLQNDSFAITVFKQDKIISLATPSYNFSQTLPLAQWDSLFFQSDRFTFTMGVDSIWKKITVNYSPNLPYKKLEMWYDSVTYQINRIKYSVSEYAGEQNFYSLSSPGAYGIVDIQFSNYQTGAFNDSAFNHWVYIANYGGVYEPSSAYSEGYQLYISSPGLANNGGR